MTTYPPPPPFPDPSSSTSPTTSTSTTHTAQPYSPFPPHQPPPHQNWIYPSHPQHHYPPPRGYQPQPSHQTQYGGYYPPPYPQLGGPGPGTMQNGYQGMMGYPNQNQQPPLPPSQTGFHPPPPSLPPMTNDHENAQQPPHPQQDQLPNHQYTPQHLHQPYYPHPYHPPAYYHPYGGYGYNSEMGYGYGGPGGGGGGGGYPVQNGQGPGQIQGGYVNGVSSGGGGGTSKGLNPTAQGFNYAGPSRRPNYPNQNPNQNQPNGNNYNSNHANGYHPNPNPINANGNGNPYSNDAPVFASIANTIQQSQAYSGVTNGVTHGEAPGHVEGGGLKWVQPVMVDGEKLKGLGGRRVSDEEVEGGLAGEDGLGLSLNGEVPSIEEEERKGEAQTEVEITEEEIIPPTNEEKAHRPLTSVPAQPDLSGPDLPAEVHVAETPSSSTTLIVEDHENWSFTGSPISGSSPATTAGQSSTGKEKLTFRSTRPDVGEKGNVYALRSKRTLREGVEVELDKDGEGGKAKSGASRMRTGRSRKSGKKAVYKTGDVGKKSGLSFGQLGPKDVEDGEKVEDVKAEPTTKPATTPKPHLPASQPTTETTSTPTPPPAPIAVAKPPPPKPTSWAALLRSEPRQFTRSTSTPNPTSNAATTSSTPRNASPAKSTISIPPESTPSIAEGEEDEAGPSTPKSKSQNLPPPPSSAPAGHAGGGGGRPAFNYAAAAAAGKGLTAVDELVKILGEGLSWGSGGRAGAAGMGKGKGKELGGGVVPRGLINVGNMCFCNTILQVLVYCPPFLELLEELGKRLKADLARKTPLLEAMIILLREFVPTGAGNAVPALKDARKEAFVPENVYDAMKENKRFDSMRRGFQEDAEEYLGFFLDTLHEELLYILSRTTPSRSASQPPKSASHSDARTIPRPLSPSADPQGSGSGWLEVGKKQKTQLIQTPQHRSSAITHLFGGSLRSTLHTPGSKDSITIEPYQPLQLDISSPEVHSLTDALRGLAQVEVVKDVWSPVKGCMVDAEKQVLLEVLPRVLVLHLKRFVYDREIGGVGKRGKLVSFGRELLIPPEIISPARRGAQPIKYKLFGVVYHHGSSATGGHYTVAVSRGDGNNWLHFDDENVQPVGVEEVVVSEEEENSGRAGLVGGRERCAYLLFLEKVR